MASPAIRVLLNTLSDEQGHARLEQCLATLGSVMPDGDESWEVLFEHVSHDLKGLVRHFHAQAVVEWEASPFGDLVEPEDIELELSALRDELQFTPVAGLFLYACGRQPIDTWFTARAAATLAREFSGVIDFLGALTPPEPPDYAGNDRWDRDWSEVAAPVKTMLRSIPGRIVTVPYEGHDSRLSAHHFADVDFLLGWMAHPHFHLLTD